MTRTGKKAEAREKGPKGIQGKKTGLDVAEEIDAQLVYLGEIASLLSALSGCKTTATIQMSCVLDDLCGRIERLKASIEELKGFRRE